MVSKSSNIQRKELIIMDIRKLGFKTTMISFLVSAALMLSTCMVYAGDSCQIIKIRKEKSGGGSSVQIFPEKITVPVGTCTIWINWVRDTEVRVSFRENAKQCILSSGASTGFEDWNSSLANHAIFPRSCLGVKQQAWSGQNRAHTNIN